MVAIVGARTASMFATWVAFTIRIVAIDPFVTIVIRFVGASFRKWCWSRRYLSGEDEEVTCRKTFGVRVGGIGSE